MRKSMLENKKQSWLPVCGCMPGCTKNHICFFDYDYTKDYLDPLDERPGEYKEINHQIAAARANKEEPGALEKAKLWLKKVFGKDEGTSVCEFGDLQTPINLDTRDQLHDFDDDVFSFEYENIDPKSQIKYKEAGEQYQVVMRNENGPKDNFMHTSTISLFDPHIESATLFGLQAHFHAPSEHSINGKLMDLEMHIVHALDPKLVNPANPAQKSQFTNGVLGFLFKAVEEDFFEKNKTSDYHDEFLRKMLEDQQAPRKTGQKLDLTKFVKLLNYDRRWTYSGSLTTAPFAEGILWNVVEQVIPIRQSTLDAFVEYRKIEEACIFARFGSEAEKRALVQSRAGHPANTKLYETDQGEKFFRFAICNRVVCDTGDRPVYHIDTKK